MVPITYNLRSLAARKAMTISAALGIGLAVFVLAAGLMLTGSIHKTLGKAGHPDRAIVLRRGSEAEMTSSFNAQSTGLMASAPGVVANSKGVRAVGEEVGTFQLLRIGTQQSSDVLVRGVPADVMSFRPEVRIVSGRAAKPGTDEAIVGVRSLGRFEGLEVGKSVALRKSRPIQIVGSFEAEGSSMESEVWADIDAVRGAFGQEGMISAIRVQLESPDKLGALRTFVESQPQLGLHVEREDIWYEKQSEGIASLVTVVGTLLAFFFGLGALIGAMITMHASITRRRREIGVLRALGFSRVSILVSFLLESFMLAILGGIVGVLGALAMGFVQFSMVNTLTWSLVVFSFDPNVHILLIALICGGVMGLLGGLFPAIGASRVSPVEAMRG